MLFPVAVAVGGQSEFIVFREKIADECAVVQDAAFVFSRFAVEKDICRVREASNIDPSDFLDPEYAEIESPALGVENGAASDHEKGDAKPVE